MKELEYPFDVKKILSGKIKLRRLLLEKADGFIEKRIAILGGGTTSDIKDVMELFLLNQGIRPSFYESEYNQYYQEAMFPTEEFIKFSPDVIYICTSNHNIERYPSFSDSEEYVDQLFSEESEKYCAIWEKLEQQFHCPIIQNNFEMPAYRLLGNRDAYDYRGRTNFLMRLNMEFSRQASQRDHLLLCDLNYISSDYGLGKWSDIYYYCMYKYAMHIEAVPYLAFQAANIIKSLFGRNKKGLVLDLDNTLWGGIVGDDGVDNLAIGSELPKGQIYTQFQQYIKEYKKIGVFLAIDSKNDYENAVAGLEHPDSVLSKEDFVSIYANWEPKDQNLLAIADELQVLPESLVFIDDNPAERYMVEEQIDGVSVPNIGKVQDYIRIIDRSGFFEVTSLSEDDQKRVVMYQENAKRKQMQMNFSDYGEYLQSLEMQAVIREFDKVHFSRIAQLSNKSNQFNLTTRRYTKEEIEGIANDSSYITLYGRLQDRFGDNGVVSVVIGQIEGKNCHIRLWIMSCRVLKRDMENAMMDCFAARCSERGVGQIYGYYYPTRKNGMVKDFYKEMGFEKISEDAVFNTVWSLDIAKGYQKRNKFILVDF
ncbi:HAD-IIIC family phosphatase [bacterium 1xD8-6]|nr:HAD-IIIC family phosphatase [bacterium D16-36]RKI69576.1 HAD-IIIC family phosphatase [bacterium 1xD8-6]